MPHIASQGYIPGPALCKIKLMSLTRELYLTRGDNKPSLVVSRASYQPSICEDDSRASRSSSRQRRFGMGRKEWRIPSLKSIISSRNIWAAHLKRCPALHFTEKATSMSISDLSCSINRTVADEWFWFSSPLPPPSQIWKLATAVSGKLFRVPAEASKRSWSIAVVWVYDFCSIQA